MTDFYASANGQRVNAASITVPFYGLPTAEVTLATDAPLVAPVTLKIGSLTARMGIIRQAPFAGVTSALLVGGAGRWSETVTIGPYENPSGVMLSTVLGDLAKATRSNPASASTGERVALTSDRSLGTLYVPEKAPAARLLRDLAGSLWWADLATGDTHVGPRASTTITTPASVEGRVGARGWLEVATEDPGSWMPGERYSGVTVTDTITVAASRFHFANEGKLRVSILTSDMLATADPNAPTAQDRTMAALRALVRGEDTRRTYHGVYEYTVARADGSTFDGLPVDASVAPPLPKNVPWRPSLAGSTCIPKAGTLALVSFVNGDPTRPYVHAFDSTLPTEETIDASTYVHVGPTADKVLIGPNSEAVVTGSGFARMARVGDTYTLGTATGVLTFVSTPDPNGPTKLRG